MSSRDERENTVLRWEYYPNNIGNVSMGRGKDYGFRICGRQEGGLLAFVLDTFRKHGIVIYSFRADSDRMKKEIALSISCDFSSGNISPVGLVTELRKSSLVGEVVYSSLRNRVFDGFLFPLTIMGSDRIIGMESNFLFQIQEQMNTEAARTLLEGLGRKYIAGVSERIREKAGKSDLLENVLDYLRAAGWGTFSIEKEESGDFRINIADPPVSETTGDATGNSFVHGIAAGIVNGFKGNERQRVFNESYDSMERFLSIEFSDMDKQAAPEKRLLAVQRADKAADKSPAIEVERIVGILLSKANPARRGKTKDGYDSTSNRDGGVAKTIESEESNALSEDNSSSDDDIALWFGQTILPE